MGMFSTSQRRTPRNRAVRPLPKPLKRYTVKKLKNIKGVARQRTLRKPVPSATVPGSPINSPVMPGANTSYKRMLRTAQSMPTLREKAMVSFIRFRLPDA